MFDLPETAKSVAAAAAGAVGLAVWWVRGAPGRREGRFRNKIEKLEFEMDKAQHENDEERYNQLSAERQRLLTDWVR